VVPPPPAAAASAAFEVRAPPSSLWYLMPTKVKQEQPEGKMEGEEAAEYGDAKVEPVDWDEETKTEPCDDDDAAKTEPPSPVPDSPTAVKAFLP
jgi:hypothetical protein